MVFSSRFYGLTVQLALFVAAMLTLAPAQALVRYQLNVPSTAQQLMITEVNKKREADQLVVYWPKFGKTTRTAPDGVEVAAEPVLNAGKNIYKVVKTTNIWDCQSQKNLAACGSMAIPANGVVLSASGKLKDTLFRALLPGTQFELKPLYQYESQFPVSAIDPTDATNPAGAGFPGARGSNQLVIYTPNYAQSTTGTNEFGFEVTVCADRVTAREGSNSVIPLNDGCYVLSGHGKAKDWLLKEVPEGSQVSMTQMEGQAPMVTASVDKTTYFEQINTLSRDIQAISGTSLPYEEQVRLNNLQLQSLRQPDDAVIAELLNLQTDMEQTYFRSFPPAFRGVNQIKGVWHRPKQDSVAAIDQTLDKYKAAGINTVFLETYLHGDPIFPSRTFAQYGIPQKLPFTTVDNTPNLLSAWITEAHKRGMKLHIWFQTFYAGNINVDKTAGGILSTYPQWANVQKVGIGRTPPAASSLEPGAYFLDPANPDVRTFLKAFITEIVTGYPIDGFQLDYIRYPASLPPDRSGSQDSTWGYSDYARKQFAKVFAEQRARQLVSRQIQTEKAAAEAAKKPAKAKPVSAKKAVPEKPLTPEQQALKKKDTVTLATLLALGFDPADINPKQAPDVWKAWNDFKTEQVNTFVEEVTNSIRATKPNVVISAAIFPNAEEAVKRKHQNWKLWADKGWVTTIAPMTLTSSIKKVNEDTVYMAKEASNSNIITGVFGPFNGNDPADVLRQLWSANEGGAAGVILFEGSHLTEEMLKAFAQGIFK